MYYQRWYIYSWMWLSYYASTVSSWWVFSICCIYKTNTTGGLKVAQLQVFGNNYDQRQNVERIMVLVITDGVPTYDADKLDEEVATIKRWDIRIVGLGVTNKVWLFCSFLSDKAVFGVTVCREAVGAGRAGPTTVTSCAGSVRRYDHLSRYEHIQCTGYY